MVTDLSALMLPALPAMLRTAGAAAMAPAFTVIPMRLRVALAAGAAWIALPLGAHGEVPSGPWWMWAPLELMAGLCIGGMAAAAVEALRCMGRVAGEQMGLGLGEAYDPSHASEANAAESMMGWAGAAAFVAVGGIESVVLAASHAAPRDGQAWMLSARGMAQTLDAAMSVGLRVCLPVLAVTLAGAAIGGAVVRAAPRTVTLAGGFGVRAAMGLGMLVSAAGTAWAMQSELVQGVMRTLPGGNIW